MRLLTLTDVLTIAGPERERLLEADGAIRDILTLIDTQAVEDRLDSELISAALIDLLLLAAARLAVAARPKTEAARLSGEFAALAEQALEWAQTRTASSPGRELH